MNILVNTKTKEFLLDTWYAPSRLSIRFIVNSLSGSEVSQDLLDNIRDFHKSNPLTDVSVSIINLDIPSLFPNCAIYDTYSLIDFDGIIIATDIISWQTSLSSFSKDKYFYFYDISILNKISQDLLKQINDSKVIIFSRTKDHNQKLKSFGFTNVCDFACMYIDINIILELLNDRRKKSS